MIKKTFIILKVFLIVISLLLINRCEFFTPFDLELLEISDEKLNYDLFESKKEFIISYADSFDVKWSAEVSNDWINLSDTSGTINKNNPDTIFVGIDRTNLTDGDYHGNIEITIKGKGSKLNIAVFMGIKSVPSFSVDSLSFGASDTTKTITLKNEGNFPLKWKFTPSENWIEVSPDSGILGFDSTKILQKVTNISANNETTISVKINNEKANTGPNSGKLDVDLNGKKQTIKIDFNKSAEPLLGVSLQEIDFGEKDIQKILTISNLGGKTLNWTATTNADWISIFPNSGSDTSSTETIVNVDRSKLTPGNFVSSIDIKSNGGDLTIPVKLIIPTIPKLFISKTEIAFGLDETLKKIEIKNIGTGKLVWTASPAESWIKVTPTKDSSTSEIKVLDINVDRSNLTASDYTGSIKIESNAGDSLINIKMKVEDKPVLSVTPKQIHFDMNTSQHKIELVNVGRGELTWQINNTLPWLSIEPKSGILTNEPVELIVNGDISGFNAGSFNQKFEITSNGGNQIVDVIVTVVHNPELLVSPLKFDFTAIDTVKILEIKNSGNGNLNWNLSGDRDWLKFSKKEGSISRETEKVEVIIDRTNLAVGNYAGNINITSNGGNVVIPILMAKEDLPLLSVAPNRLDFTAIDTVKFIEIKNIGNAVLNWSLSGDRDWLKFSKTEGSNSGETEKIEVIVDRTNLSVGNYAGNINITSNRGSSVIPITLVVEELPLLSVTPNRLDFTAIDTVKFIEIKNIGKKVLNWSLSGDRDWLKFSKTEGSNSGETEKIEVIVDRTNLSVGNYAGNINITSNRGSSVIPITLVVEELPLLSVTPNRLDFTAIDTVKTLEIKNSGSGKLNWSLSGDRDWLKFSKTEGSNSGETEKIEVIVDRTNLSVGNYAGNINITSNRGSSVIPITLVVEELPLLSVTPNRLDFTAIDTVKFIEIKNIGKKVLNWSLSGDRDWLKFSKTEGSNSGETEKIEVIVDRTNLSVGNYAGNINITSNRGSSVIPITLVVEELPLLSVTPNRLDFTAIDTVKFIEIKNIGKKVLNWSLSGDRDWLKFSKTEGSNSGETEKIEVIIDRINLAVGNYAGNINITSNRGSSIIPITMVVEELPRLSFQPSTLDFGETVTSHVFEISNIGKGKLNWTISTENSWITVSDLSGTTESIAKEIRVFVDRKNLTTGNYVGNVNIKSDGGDGSIEIKMIVSENPILLIEPNVLDFSSSINSLPLKLSNTGTGNLNWSVKSISENWVSVTPQSGSIQNQPQDVTVNVVRSGLAANNYSADVVLTSNGGDKTVTVKMDVEANPLVDVSQSSINFDAATTSKQFDIKNVGGGNLGWNLSVDYTSDNASVQWLDFTPTTGSLGANEKSTITVSVKNTSDLTSSTYTANLIVSSNGGSKTLQVTLNLGSPQLNLSTKLLDFGETETQKSIHISNSGSFELNWSIDKDQNWIQQDVSSGTATTEVDIVNITVDRNNIVATGALNKTNNNEYFGHVFVTSNGGSDTVKVKVTIASTTQPNLSVTPTSLYFGSTDTQLPLNISNTGGGTLNWSISSDVNWTLFDFPSGTTTTETDVVQVTATKDASPGTYNGKIKITWDGGKFTEIPVSMEVF